MSLRFLPAGVRCAAGNLSALFLGKFSGAGLAALFAAKLTQLDRSGVLAVRLTLW